MSVHANASLAYATGRSVLVPARIGVVMAVTILPVAIVGMSAGKTVAMFSLPFALLWLALVPLAIYKRWAALALPAVAATLLAFAILVLPFGSAAFMVDYWTSAFLLLLSWPRR